MKRLTLACSIILLLATFFISCSSENEAILIPEYVVTVTPVSDSNAPALQSFAHGVNGSEVLLFAGRTNSTATNDDGGLHDINGKNANYANTSFLPPSFNESIFVYNIETNTAPISISFDEMVERIKNYKPDPNSELIIEAISEIVSILPKFETVFRTTNPLITQDEDGFLYTIGGYGTPLDSTTIQQGYKTFDQVARIHIPSMINLVKNQNLDQIQWDKLFAFGRNSKLISTGGEVFKIGDTFYLAGGHNFGSSTPNGQQYVDAVYPFTLSASSKPLELTVTVGTPITDIAISELGTPTADATSEFRRRDGPIVPALFLDASQNLTQGLTFYGGVFRPDSLVIVGTDTTKYLLGWNTAIYVHPSISSSNPLPASPYYSIDPSFYQGNLNIYACSDLEIYDSYSNTVSTFLIGGIGDGTYQTNITLSPFTNSLMQIRYDLKTRSSVPKILSNNIFGGTNFYGAESAFIFNSNANLKYKSVNGVKTEVIDASGTFTPGQSVDVGYVYGGIEAFDPKAGTFGPNKSAASNKVWKVTITKNTVNQ